MDSRTLCDGETRIGRASLARLRSIGERVVESPLLGGLMWFRLLPLLGPLLLSQLVLAQHLETAQSEVVPESCPVTRPYQTSRFVPPSPYWTKEGTGRFWFGTDKLWTALPIDGVWQGLSFAKLFWWRQGYDAYREPQPKLIITGKRLDFLAPNLKADHATNAFAPPRSAMLIGVEFPTAGCWKIRGRYEDDELTFVAWVVEKTPRASCTLPTGGSLVEVPVKSGSPMFCGIVYCEGKSIRVCTRG